jgi:hypothetical protein
MSQATDKLRAPTTFNWLSRTRFRKNRMDALFRHIGHKPSIVEQILVDRIISMEWALRRLDVRLAQEDLTSDQLRAALRSMVPVECQLRMDLMAIGLQPAPQPVKPLWQVLQEEAAAGAARVAIGKPDWAEPDPSAPASAQVEKTA